MAQPNNALAGSTCEARVVLVQELPPVTATAPDGSARGPSWLATVVSWTPLVQELEGKQIFLVVADENPGPLPPELVKDLAAAHIGRVE